MVSDIDKASEEMQANKAETSNKFVKLLTRDNSKVQRARAERLGKVTKSEMESLISELETKKLTIEDQLDSQLDVTTANDLTSMNAIRDWDAKDFIKKRVEMEVELENIQINLNKALKVDRDLFG